MKEENTIETVSAKVARNEKIGKAIREMKLVPSTWKICKDEELNQIKTKAWEKAKELGYVDNEIEPTLWTFKASSSWGQSRYFNGVPINAVGIERVFLKDPKAATETIVHEIAHLCAKGDDHGKLWKARGDKIGESFGGIKMSRVDSPEDIGIDPHLMDYHTMCPHCKKIEHWPEICSVWKNPQNYRCIICGHPGLRKCTVDGKEISE